jgi:membrane fusion protein (multidrug efflux system)
MANSILSSEPSAPRPRYWLRIVLTVLGAVLLIGAIVGVKAMFIVKQMNSFKPPPPPTVTTAKAEALEWRDKIDTVGSLRAWRGADLSTEAAGLARAVRFASGQNVASGQVLVELNADPERAQLQALQAQADLARTVLARDRDQLAASAVSQATIDADEADLKNKLAQVEQERALVDKKIIRAPFAGRTGITTVNPGQYLNTGDKIVTLQSIDTIYADFNVPQRELGRVSLGAEVGVAVDAFPQRSFTGKVTAISSAVDTGTRNVLVEATIRNPKHELLPGMFAKVALQVGTRAKYITIPQAAVAFNPYGATVFVAQEGKNDKGEATLTAKQVFITTGATRGDQVAVVKGLQEGDTVVTSGQLKLKNGAALQVDNKVQPLNDPNPTPQEH